MNADFTFTYHPDQRKHFRDGSLADEWRLHYPMLFDAKDRELLKTGHQAQYHFFEWLSAVLLYEATGYLSLVEGYTAKTHKEKREKLRDTVGVEIFNWLDENQSGQPDLFVYRRGTDQWFFCEVKGGPDKTRGNQLKWMAGFRECLRRQKVRGERVRLIQLKEIRF
jgi:hypothetical protein